MGCWPHHLSGSFDLMTPIISMMSNSRLNEILTYYSHGMLGCIFLSLLQLTAHHQE